MEAVSISAPLWIVIAVIAAIVIAFLLFRGRGRRVY